MRFPYDIGRRILPHQLITKILAKRLHKQISNGDIDGAGKTLKRLLSVLKDQSNQQIDPSKIKGYSEAKMYVLRAKEMAKRLPGAQEARTSIEKLLDTLEFASDQIEKLVERIPL